MSLVQDRCICLRRLEYSETSQILTLLSRVNGLQRLIAKGAHRKTKAGASKFGGGIDLLELGDAVFTLRPDKDLATLTEWKLIDGHIELRRNLRGLYLGQYAAEMVGVLLEEHDPHPEVFDRLEQALGELATPRIEEAFVAFELDLLHHAGIEPQWSDCTHCGQAVKAAQGCAFSPAQGGVTCENCQGRFPDRVSLQPTLLEIVRTILRFPERLPRITRRQSDPLNRLLARHIEYTSEKRLRLASYVM